MTSTAPRWRPATAFTVIGGGCVVAGGLVAAATSPLSIPHGSWMAAYLVLVGGVAQYAMGRARRWLPETAQPPLWGWIGVIGWNLGNLAVILGTLLGLPPLVYVGSAALVVGLLVALDATRPVATASVGKTNARLGLAYRVMLLVLAVSIPVGMTLSHLRHS